MLAHPFTRPPVALAALLGAMTLSSLACFAPSREDYRDDLAMAHCERLDACGKLNSTHGSLDDCLVKKRSDYNDLWPADKCSDGRINPDSAQACIARQSSRSCNANFLDDLAFLQECSANKVCTEPPK